MGGNSTVTKIKYLDTSQNPILINIGHIFFVGFIVSLKLSSNHKYLPCFLHGKNTLFVGPSQKEQSHTIEASSPVLWILLVPTYCHGNCVGTTPVMKVRPHMFPAATCNHSIMFKLHKQNIFSCTNLFFIPGFNSSNG